MRRIEFGGVRKTKRSLPTEGHALAHEIAEYYREERLYQIFLQFVRRLGVTVVRANFDEARRAERQRTPALLIWLCKKK